MCPQSPSSPVAIGLYWTDKHIVLSLDKFLRGSPLPCDVIEDVNPYQNQPFYLPPQIWYLVNSTEPKETKNGFWKAKGDPCEIFEDSAILGWRTTLEFFEGRAPNGQKTDWVMQEYKITQKGMQKENQMQSRALCRVFHCSDEGSLFVVPNTNSTSGGASAKLLHEAEIICDEAIIDCISREGFLELDDLNSSSGGASAKLLHEAEIICDEAIVDCISSEGFLELDDLINSTSGGASAELLHEAEIICDEAIIDCISSEDFLELNDLIDDDDGKSPEICRSKYPSDEDDSDGDYLELNDLGKDIMKSHAVEKPKAPLYEIAYQELSDLTEFASYCSSSSANSSHRNSYDFFALLSDLDNEMQGNGSDEAILQPATSELIVWESKSEPQVETQPASSMKAKSSDKDIKDPNVKRPKPEYKNEGPSPSNASSSSSTSRHRKKLKKYFCFLPF